ncbi:hypothetical protein M5J15_07450 [Serratia symbiotica]|uniref:putative phage tail protein n=1 Tax=Serratia symbiotica TaxID=138074 RepID=UPI00209083A5|nr:putative phage tail protein [Serratia symbiotica]USS96630.1 hypothetical protein M5J15_07450 [Serratia symbiotica]
MGKRRSLLSDWERVLALSVDDSMTLQQRRQQVLAKINATHAGDRIWTPEIICVWIVTIDDAQVPVYRFRAGSSVAGERLITFGQNLIENLFQDLKPAHTQVVFNYKEKTTP